MSYANIALLKNLFFFQTGFFPFMDCETHASSLLSVKYPLTETKIDKFRICVKRVARAEHLCVWTRVLGPGSRLIKVEKSSEEKNLLLKLLFLQRTIAKKERKISWWQNRTRRILAFNVWSQYSCDFQTNFTRNFLMYVRGCWKAVRKACGNVIPFTQCFHLLLN